MDHNFSPEIATLYGVNAAIFLHNIAFWINKNAANNHNFEQDRYWTYNSQKAFTQLFPYWTRQNLRTIIKLCADKGLILIGNHNETTYDRTGWYALTDKGLALFPSLFAIGWNQPMERLESTNGLVGINPPIPDNKPDDKPDIKASTSLDDDVFKIESTFHLFWEAYPKKVAKQDAQRAWKKNKLYDHTERILTDLALRKTNNWLGKDKQYIPNPATYLDGERWNDELTEGKKNVSTKTDKSNIVKNRLRQEYLESLNATESIG